MEMVADTGLLASLDVMELDAAWILTDSRYRNVLMQPRVRHFAKHPVLHAEWLYLDLE